MNFADKNGHPYESLGRILREKFPPGTVNLHTLERELRSLPEAEREAFLDKNPSYVFFRVSTESATTTLGAEATEGRTIATDARWFPKGALAYLEFPKPRFSSNDALIPEAEGDPVSRLVMDQDTGGAILGGGRLDLFWGRGAQAQRYAGVMQHTGKLWYLIPRKKTEP
jgi:membrane-bound lytic murein transglycosylase A